jgi:membrane protein
MGSETAMQVSQILIKSTEKSTIWGSMVSSFYLLDQQPYSWSYKIIKLNLACGSSSTKGIFTILKARLFSFGLILLTLLLLVSLIISTGLSSIANWIKGYTDDSTIFFSTY